MTVGTLDVTRTIPARLKCLGASVNFFAELLDMPSGTMSNFLTGKKNLSGDKSKKFSTMIEGLERLARAFAPAPVSYRDADLILDLIQRLDEGTLIVSVVDESYFHLEGLDFGKMDGYR